MMGHPNDVSTWAEWHRIQRAKYRARRARRLARRLAYFFAVVGLLTIVAAIAS